MNALKRIEELERQLAVLKAEFVEEEEVKYPCVMKEGRCVWYMETKEKGFQLNAIDSDFGFELTDGLISGGDLFTGTITYKDGKPV